MSERELFDNAKRDMSEAHETGSSLCDPFLAVIPSVGAAVSVLAGSAGPSTECASDEVAARLDELQFDLGEGPCWEAMTTRRPVLAPEFTSTPHPNWPMFAEALRADRVTRGVKSIYAFPLVVGALEIGAIDLYSLAPDRLTLRQVQEAVELARIAAWQVMRRILTSDQAALDGGSEPMGASRREVHQATGMLLAQLDISAADAALLLRAHAFSTGRPVADVARDIIERRLDLSSEGI